MQSGFFLLMSVATMIVALVWVALLLHQGMQARERAGARATSTPDGGSPRSDSTGQQPRRHLAWAAAAGASLALYVFAVWCEAACWTADIGHNEIITWSRMIEALGATSWSDLEFPVWMWPMMPLEPIGVLGMVGVLVWGALRWRPMSDGVRVVVWGYSLLLIVAGGWVALLAFLLQLPQFPPDGEFLDEGVARLAALGMWVMVCLCACWFVRPAGSRRRSLAGAT